MTKRLSSNKWFGLVRVMGMASEACSMLDRKLRVNPGMASQAVFQGRQAKELRQTFRELARDAHRYETTLKGASQEQFNEALVSDMWTIADAVAILGWVYGNMALRELEQHLSPAGAAGEGLDDARALFASAIQQLDLVRDILEQRLRVEGRLNQKA